MALQTPATRARPTLTSADLIRRRQISDPAPTPTGAPIQGAAVSVTRGMARPAMAPRPATAVARAPSPQPNVTGMTGFARENTLANAGIYEPGSIGAVNAVANRTGRPYNPPAQTERKNPLTGDNNFPMEGQTVPVARAPFIQRGASLAAGQDAAPVRETLDEDASIAGSMQGTQARLRGTGPSPFARRFGSPAAQNSYDSLLKRVVGA